MGGQVWEKIPITRFIGIGSPEEVAEEALAAVRQGINTIKLKVGHDLSQDVEIVRSAREVVGDNVVIRVDANQAWSVGTAITQINRMARYNVQFVEQPIPRWDRVGLTRLRDKVGVPICICEGWGYEHHIDKLPLLLQLIQERALDFLSTDPYRTGGLRGFMKTCAICEAAGIPIVSHWNHTGLGVSTATWLHACSSNRIVMHGQDILCTNLKPGPVDDIVTAPFHHENGYLEVPSGPGLGIQLDEAKMEKWRSRPGPLSRHPKAEVEYPINNLRIRPGYAPPRY
jgi:L-alanine-DL-glutamate epimerase-like enolase superfamily enzyme